jgi:hypothetical protein
MPTVIHLSLHPDEHGKVTPFEILRDVADVNRGWSYLEEDSWHYTDLKDAPGLALRHRIEPSAYVDFGFVEATADPSTVDLAVLDRPDAETLLSPDERADLIDTFLDAMRDYLSERPDHVTPRVERDATDSAAR